MHVLVVGSSVIDLFLTLEQQHFQIENQKVLLTLGDKVPSDVKAMTLGGNGSNASVGLTRLEIPTTFYTYLGSDALSREIETGLTREGVDLKAQKDDKATSMSIIFDFDSDRIIFAHHQVRDHKFTITDKNYDYIYLHSIGDPWEEVYKEVLEYSKTNNVPLAFSPGSHQIEAGGEVLGDTIRNSKIFFSNRDEAAKIANTDPESDIKDLLSNIKSQGPEIVSITDGGNGSYAVDKSGNMYFIKPSPAAGVEKTGAGDAYASAFFAGILHGATTAQAMLWGVNNAAGVMSKIGGQTGLLTKVELDESLKNSNNLTAESI